MEGIIVTKTHSDSDFLKTVGKKLNSFRSTGKYCDFTLKTEDGGSFPCHKVILEASSSYFSTFNFNSHGNGANIYYKVPKISSNILKSIMDFMYMGKVELSSEIARDVLDHSLILGIMSLVNACTDVLIDSINNMNCFDLLLYSETYNYGEKLTRKCFEYILENSNLFKAERFYQISHVLMESLLLYDRENLECDEEELSLGVVNWIAFDITARECYLNTFLNKIKFEKISHEFWVIKLLNFEPLMKSNIYLTQIVKIAREDIKKQLDLNSGVKTFLRYNSSQQVEDQLENVPSKNMYVVINQKLLLYNLELQKFEKMIAKITHGGCPRQLFGDTVFNEDNYFVCGGINRSKGTKLDDCEYFSMKENLWKTLPPMSSTRYGHRVINLQNKIYVCAGDSNTTVEIFDINSSSWSFGPEVNRNMVNFGICTHNDCIYIASHNNFQRYDPRDNKWITLPLGCPNQCPSTISFDNFIYGFDRMGISTFDVRNLKWLDDRKLHQQRYWAHPMACLIDEEIFVFGFSSDADSKGLLQSYSAQDLSYSKCYLTNFGRNNSRVVCSVFSM